MLFDNVPYFKTTRVSDSNKLGTYKKGHKFSINQCIVANDDTGGTIYWVYDTSKKCYAVLADDSGTYLKITKTDTAHSDVVKQTPYKDNKGNVVYYQTVTPINIDFTTAYSSGGDLTISYCIPSEKTSGCKAVTTLNNLTGKGDTLTFNKSVYSQKTVEMADKLPNGEKITAKTPYQVKEVNLNSYPKATASGSGINTKYDYDYTISIQSDIKEAIKNIKYNMNIPSAYSRLELNKLFHMQFNRFRVQYPDYFMNNTIGYVFLTRPDLNLFDSNGNMLSQVANDPQLYYVVNANKKTALSLTNKFSSDHDFNPILSNTITSLDVSDESIDTLETGETFTGFKTQYAKSNIRSMTAGTISVKYPETYNMSITHLFQLWCTYESSVYRGSLKPKDEYIWNRELDYACDIYYFLLDVEDNIIRYWCKYTGCFPLNVNKSVFSWDIGTQIQHPELNITFAYFAREDMSPTTLNEFNNNSKGAPNGFKYKNVIGPNGGVNGPGNTWSNAPFVQQINRPDGFGNQSELFALRYRV